MGEIGRERICIRIKNMVRVKDKVRGNTVLKDKVNMVVKVKTKATINIKDQDKGNMGININLNPRISPTAKTNTPEAKINNMVRKDTEVKVLMKVIMPLVVVRILEPTTRVNTIKDLLLVVKVNYHFRDLLRGIILRTSNLFPLSYPSPSFLSTPGLYFSSLRSRTGLGLIM